MNDYELLYYIYLKDEEALAMLIEKHKKNIQCTMRKIVEQNGYVCASDDEFDEMLHLGVLELYQAIYNYCDDGRCTFQVFATKCIEMCIRKYIRHRRSGANNRFATAISLDSQIKENEGIYYVDSIRSTNIEFQGEMVLEWYHEKNLLEFLEKHLKEKDYLIVKMIIEGYTRVEISQELVIQPKRVYYVCDKIKKLLLSYID